MSKGNSNPIRVHLDELKVIRKILANDDTDFEIFYSDEFALAEIDMAIIEQLEDLRERILSIKL